MNIIILVLFFIYVDYYIPMHNLSHLKPKMTSRHKLVQVLLELVNKFSDHWKGKNGTRSDTLLLSNIVKLYICFAATTSQCIF